MKLIVLIYYYYYYYYYNFSYICQFYFVNHSVISCTFRLLCRFSDRLSIKHVAYVIMLSKCRAAIMLMYAQIVNSESWLVTGESHEQGYYVVGPLICS